MSVADDERAALRDAARSLLARESASERVRALLEDPTGYDPKLWDQMAELGWTGLLVPEAEGGEGAGFGDVAVVLEELGRHLTPSPYLASAVLATSALVMAGDEAQRAAWLPALACGDRIGTVALCGLAGRYERVDVTATATAGGWRLDGVAGFVPDAAAAHAVVVRASESDRDTLLLVETGTSGLTIEPTPTVDRTRRLATLRFDGVEVGADARLGAAGDDAGAIVAGLLDRAVIAVSLDGAGGAARVLEMAVEYAKQREQFGRPIGSFQAVKHKLADMLVCSQGATAAAEHAADVVDTDADTVREAAALAGAYALDAYARVAGDAVQVHGGIGFTWEHDCHLYLKRAKLNQQLFGDPGLHRDRLACIRIAAAETRG